MAEALLEVDDLHTHFHLKNKVVRAVNGVSFSVRRGEIVGIAGESGAGKSVACLSILRLVPNPGRIERGRILFTGEDLLGKTERQMRELRGQTVSMVFEDPLNSLDPAFTVGDLIGEALILHKGLSKRQAWKKAGELLRLVGIPDPERRLDNYAHELSGGMQQRVMIAIALSCDPALLIADNPTTALDVTIQIHILDLVKQLRDRLGMGVLWITHDLGVVASSATAWSSCTRASHDRATSTKCSASTASVRAGSSTLPSSAARARQCARAGRRSHLSGCRSRRCCGRPECERTTLLDRPQACTVACSRRNARATAAARSIASREALSDAAGLLGQGPAHAVRAIEGQLRHRGRGRRPDQQRYLARPRQADDVSSRPTSGDIARRRRSAACPERADCGGRCRWSSGIRSRSIG
jgi:ABC-type dipeptide/oligopeptide/nickel transport system ATPase subunit